MGFGGTPEGASVGRGDLADKLLRALIGVAMFSSAYMAEVVRGGLQAIPKGQYEGAMAVGLSYWQMMGKVILPQAAAVTEAGPTFIEAAHAAGIRVGAWTVDEPGDVERQ